MEIRVGLIDVEKGIVSSGSVVIRNWGRLVNRIGNAETRRYVLRVSV